jgi:dUTP pyrophosphatase
MQLKIKRIVDKVPMPKYAYAADAGFDLYASESFVLNAGESLLVGAGIMMEIPEGFVGLIWDKSGIANNRHIKTVGGVVDSGYRGEIKVGLVNLGKEAQEFKVGDKIAQMLIQKIEYPEFIEVDELENSERGDRGFGSSGNK